MNYPGEDLSILQLLFALNNKLSGPSVPGTEKLSVYKHAVRTALATINRGVNVRRPVTRLPADILVSIPIYFDSSVIQFDLVGLTHVCRYLWDTFISARSLWSTVHIDLPARLLTLSLERSGSAPIQLHVDGDGYGQLLATVPLYQREYDALWFDLRWDQLVSVSQLTSGLISCLRVLSLDVTLEGRVHAAHQHLLFSSALTLQELTLRKDISTILDIFRFPSLTTLSLFCESPISQAKMLGLLCVSPGSKAALFDFEHLTTGGTPPALLRDLRRLWISVTASGDSYLQLITKLICPAAEDVSISAHPAYTTFGKSTTQPFLFSWGFFSQSSQVHAMELHVGKSPLKTSFSIRLLHGETSRFEISFHFVPFGSGGLFPIFRAAVSSFRALSPSGVNRLSITDIDTLTFPLTNRQFPPPSAIPQWAWNTWKLSSFRLDQYPQHA